MEQLLIGNDEAVRALYARFGRPVYTLGLRLLGSREAAEELTQDVFLTAWRKAARFDPARGRLSTWLDDHRPQPGGGSPAPGKRREPADPGPRRRGARHALGGRRGHTDGARRRDARPRVPTQAERRLLARAYFRGLTAREISEADGLPLGTVKTRLRAALIKVRRANDDKERS